MRIGGAQILAQAALIARVWEVTEPKRYVNWCPHDHDMGLMGGILYPMLLEANSVQLNPLDVIRRPAMWLEATSAHGGTASGGPAFMFAQCLERITDTLIEGLDLSSWGTAFCGAEPVPADLLPRFADRFAAAGLRPGTATPSPACRRRRRGPRSRWSTRKRGCRSRTASRA